MKTIVIDASVAIKWFIPKIHASEPLLDTAWRIATVHQCTIYDSLYVAMAKTEKCVLVTADRILHHTLSTTPLARALLWIEDIKNIA